MAINENVIVLVPNGRRQNVGVAPNTTILQVSNKNIRKLYNYIIFIKI